MKLSKYISKVLDILIALVLLLFFASFGFRDGRTSGWYQQFFPNLNGSTITSMTFLDSLTGFAVTSLNSDTNCYILRTTNGGDNWSIIYTYHPIATTLAFNKIQFANNNIGYATANYTSLFKTTNGGDNWFTLFTGLYPQDMAVVNKDTLFFVYDSGFSGGVYRSTNGGSNWQLLWGGGGSGMPSRIYMFNKYLGFDLGDAMRRTTNGGFDWTEITGEAYRDIKFIDTLTGWKASGSGIIKKTTNGGVNWFNQQLPPVSSTFYFTNLSIVNKDSLWMCGSTKIINGFEYGIMFKTTNGGNIWGYQMADTSIKLMAYAYINFLNKNIGWSYRPITGGIHTLVGGSDTTYITGINNNIISIPKNFILKQNYPNPFNSTSIIEYYLNTKGWVKLKIFDVRGKEIKTLVNEVQNAGTYGIPVSIELSSGIYFYRLQFITEKGEIQVDTKKMIVTK